MRRLLTNRRRTDQRGAVAVIVAVAMSSLLIAGGIVLDFGVVRMDRQMNKLAADDAVTAGLRAADGGTGEVYTDLAVCGALDYLKANRSRLSGSARRPLRCSGPTEGVCSRRLDHRVQLLRDHELRRHVIRGVDQVSVLGDRHQHGGRLPGGSARHACL